jgi:hypothetical protein
MRPIATLGNEYNIVAIGTYYNNLPLIATNVVVAIDLNPCSDVNGIAVSYTKWSYHGEDDGPDENYDHSLY